MISVFHRIRLNLLITNLIIQSILDVGGLKMIHENERVISFKSSCE